VTGTKEFMTEAVQNISPFCSYLKTYSLNCTKCYS